MPIPLPPTEVMRQMRFSNEFWVEFTRLLNQMTDNEIFDLSDIDTLDGSAADLFFTTLALRLIEVAGEDQMPVLDDTIILIKTILAEHLYEYELELEMQKLADRMDGKSK